MTPVFCIYIRADHLVSTYIGTYSNIPISYQEMCYTTTNFIGTDNRKGHSVADMIELLQEASQPPTKQTKCIDEDSSESEFLPHRFLEGGDEKYDAALLYHSSTRRTASLALCAAYNRQCLKLLNEVRRNQYEHGASSESGDLHTQRDKPQVVHTFSDLLRIGLRSYFSCF